MSGHTPGKWRVEETDDFTRQRVVSVTSDFLDSDRRILATFGPVGNEWAQSNARLFSAAPELLEALKGMVGLIQLIQSREPALVTNHRFIAAEEAIAKAEGRS